MEFIDRWEQLLLRERRGHMGADEFEASMMKHWSEITPTTKSDDRDFQDYYVGRGEFEVLTVGNCFEIGSRLKDPVTLVVRGPGTTFKEKDARLVRSFNVVKIVYIDVCEAALELSLHQGKKLFPEAQHEVIKGDMFDPDLDYGVMPGSTEVNTLFGLTPENLEVDVKTGRAETQALERSQVLFKQLSPGAHLITTIDTNQDGRAVEASYRGHTDFVMRMLKRNGIEAQIAYDVRFNELTHVLEHHLKFLKSETFLMRSGEEIIIKEGESFHYNSSAKFPLPFQIEVKEKAGFKNLVPADKVPTDKMGNIHLLHFQKPM